MGPGGGIFQLDLTLAKSGNCLSSATGVDSIVGNFAATGINSMTLNLEDSLLYFAYNSSNLSSISLGERLIVEYDHGLTALDAISIASYNEYLVSTTSRTVLFSGLFVRIRLRQSVTNFVAINGDVASHLYMIREEFQPLPGMQMLQFMYGPSSYTITQYHRDL